MSRRAEIASLDCPKCHTNSHMIVVYLMPQHWVYVFCLSCNESFYVISQFLLSQITILKLYACWVDFIQSLTQNPDKKGAWQ